MNLDWLADKIRAEDPHLTVIETDGWKTNVRRSSASYTPVGILNHHTAPPVPYPVDKLLKSCNLNVTPDGVVYVISAGYQWDSGMGDPKVLAAIRANLVPPWPQDRTDSERINGNPWFVDIEVDHAGDGSPLPEAAHHALLVCDAAICRHEGWDPRIRLLGHREWTRRKIDPRWDTPPDNPMPAIRQEVLTMLQGTYADEGRWPAWAHDAIEHAVDDGLMVGNVHDGQKWWHPNEPVTRAELAVVIDRLRNLGG